MKNSRALIGFVLTPALAVLAAPTWAEIRFQDATQDAGVARAGETYGSSWGDLDGNGYPDLFVSNHWNQESMFLNTGNGTFKDVARETFQWTWTPRADTHGGSWFDFDNDGDEDLFVATGIGNPDQFLLNDGGALVNFTSTLGASDRSWGGRMPVWMDYDGDGRPDFAMMMIGEPVQLMQGSPSGRSFRNVTGDVGLDCNRQQYAQFIDLTGDGRNEFLCPDNQDTGGTYPGKIYDTLATPWTNIDIGEKFPVVDAGPDAVIADFNNDGHMDIFHLSSTQIRPSGGEITDGGDHLEARLMGNGKSITFESSGPIRVKLDSNVMHDLDTVDLGYSWIHIGEDGVEPEVDGDGVFVLDPSDVEGTPAASGSLPRLRIGYEDGKWTMLLESRDTNSGESVYSDVYFEIDGNGLSDLELNGLWDDDLPDRPTLLLYDEGEGGMVDATPDDLAQPMQCVSAAAGDFNNDGWVDLYLACRTAVRNIENMLFENHEGELERVDGAGGAIGPLGLAVADGAGTADSVTVADYDVDGRLDLFVTNGFNMFPRGTGGPNALFRNVSDDGNHWIEFDVVGTDVLREGSGAVVTVTGGDLTQTRVKNGSYHRWSHDFTRMHFGLAGADEVDISVKWPDGSTDNYEGIAADAVYRLVQGSDIETVTPGAGAPYACGLPDEFAGGDLGSLEPGLYIAKNCSIDLQGLDPDRGVRTGGWLVRGVKGTAADTVDFSGHIESTGAVTPEARASLNEGQDSVETGDQTIDFAFNVRSGQDGIDFATEFPSNTCITLADMPAGTRVFYGPLKTPVDSTQFYLNNLADCPDGVPEAVANLPPPGGGNDDDDDDDDGGNDDDGDDDNGDGDDDSDDDAGGGGGGGGALSLPVLLGLVAVAALRRSRKLKVVD